MSGHFRHAQLFGWLMATHVAAALLAVAAFYLGIRQGLPPLASAAAGLALAAIGAALLTRPVRRGVEVATLALDRLLNGLPTGDLPRDGQSPVRGLLFAVNALARHYREVDAVRENALQQAQEAAIREERNRIARDLHDSIKQQLFSLSASLAAAQVRWDDDRDGARQALDDARRSAQEASAEMRALLQQLRPAALAGAGLPQALAEQCEALQYRTGAKVHCDLSEAPGPDRLPAGAAEGLFRIAQEALNNIARHAGAQEVFVRLRTVAEPLDALELEIADDGRGFDPAGASGMGLANMRERARELGARLELLTSSGQGTRVLTRLPLARIDTDLEERMTESLRTNMKQSKSGFFWALVGAGVAALMMMQILPFLGRVLQGGFSGPGWMLQFAFSVAVGLFGAITAGVNLSRSNQAVTALELSGAEGRRPLMQLARDRANALMWAFLIGAMTLPAMLLRYNEPQFPVAALALGAALVGLAVYQVLRLDRMTEQYWASLPEAAMRREVETAWQQRFTPALVMAVTLPGYLLLRFGGRPAGLWFAFPPAREDVFNMVATLYLIALAIWFALQWRQVRRWRNRAALNG